MTKLKYDKYNAYLVVSNKKWYWVIIPRMNECNVTSNRVVRITSE